MTKDDIAARRGIEYAKSIPDSLSLVEEGPYDVAFILRPTPVEQVREVARRRRDHAAEVDLLLPEDPHRNRLQPGRLTSRRWAEKYASESTFRPIGGGALRMSAW